MVKDGSSSVEARYPKRFQPPKHLGGSGGTPAKKKLKAVQLPKATPVKVKVAFDPHRIVLPLAQPNVLLPMPRFLGPPLGTRHPVQLTLSYADWFHSFSIASMPLPNCFNLRFFQRDDEHIVRRKVLASQRFPQWRERSSCAIGATFRFCTQRSGKELMNLKPWYSRGLIPNYPTRRGRGFKF
jgi:hypothetical protein